MQDSATGTAGDREYSSTDSSSSSEYEFSMTLLIAEKFFWKRVEMELSTIVGFILAACAPLIAGHIVTVINILLSLFGHRILVQEWEKVRILDRFFSTHGWCHAKIASLISKPADGWVFLWPTKGMRCLVFGMRKTNTFERNMSVTVYELLIFGAHTDMMAHISGDPRRIRETDVTIVSAYRTSSDTALIRAPAVRQAWQQKALDELLQHYHHNAQAMREFGCSVLIFGPSGAGKSTMAQIFASALRGHTFLTDTLKKEQIRIGEPRVVCIDITRPGATPDLACINEGSQDTPIVIGVDELDVVIAHALNTTKPVSEGSSLADTKALLHRFLDNIAKRDHVSLIATMNTNPSELDETFTRLGRFDFWVHVVSTGDDDDTYDCTIQPAPQPKPETKSNAK